MISDFLRFGINLPRLTATDFSRENDPLLQPAVGSFLPPPLIIPSSARLIVTLEPPVPAIVRLLAGSASTEGLDAVVRTREDILRQKKSDHAGSATAKLAASYVAFSDSLSHLESEKPRQLDMLPSLPIFVQIKEGIFEVELVRDEVGHDA